MDEGSAHRGRVLGVSFYHSTIRIDFPHGDTVCRDWTMYSAPAPAHPSYRLITALRLYHIIPLSAEVIPPNSEQLLDQWRNTTLGHQDTISIENERLWRGTLLKLCEDVVRIGEAGVKRTCMVGNISAPASAFPVGYAKVSIEALWKEETTVATAVMRSLENNEEF